MASNPKDPMSRFFDVDIAGGQRSNFNWSYKNRLTIDYGYLYPVGLWDVPSDVHFELDLFAALSSNPTLAPLLGKAKLRVEAYYIEKAADNNDLRNNERMPLDRDIAWPQFPHIADSGKFSPRGSLLELLQMYPVGWDSTYFNDEDPNYTTQPLNAIPFLMYYDIYRNYYINPQDPQVPLRVHGFVPGVINPDYDPDDPTSVKWEREPDPIVDAFITRDKLDSFVSQSRATGATATDIRRNFRNIFSYDPLPTYSTSAADHSAPTEIDHLAHKHYGLLRRTYNNDFFTSFVSNENVELMKSSSIVSTPGGQISVEQIALANRNWRIRTRSILWGTDWKDFNKVHYGVNLMIPYGRPQFLGALSSDITFNDVISQAQTGPQDSAPLTNNNLGSRAGLAYGALGHKGRFVEFNSKDECYVMVLASLVPEVDYYQGIDPMYFKTNLKHSWMVELNSVGMQDFPKAWATAVRGADIGSKSWYEHNVALHQVPVWFEYMAKYNQLHGDFTGENQNRYWVFARPFDDLNRLFPGSFDEVTAAPQQDNNFSTYVLPELFNYVFANNLGSDNFQLQINFDCKVSSMLDKQVIAYL